MTIISRGLFFAAFLLALSACDSSEERAQTHFENALSLLAEGDIDRALIEFRNTLALDQSHREARKTFARINRESGNVAEAYANYLRLSEEYPDDIDARLALAEMAILSQNWDEAQRHGRVVIEANPDLPAAKVLENALEFKSAFEAKDAPRIRELTREAEKLAEADPTNEIVSRVLVQGYMTTERIDDAIDVTRNMIANDTDKKLFYDVLTDLLILRRDTDDLEAHLRNTIAKFPDDTVTKRRYLQYLVSDGQSDKAEEFLRTEITTAENKASAFASLIVFIRQFRGDEAALAEIDKGLADYDSAPLLIALKAGLLHDQGAEDEAISLMQSITEGQEPSPQVDNYKVALARMLIEAGNDVGARKLVEEVLEHDAGQVNALKLQAIWQIAADKPDEAIATMRRALDGAPDDSEAMTIMAQAHERNGDIQLAHDLLALAVEASDSAPAESLRFAKVQISKERYNSAEEVLIRALRRTPRNLGLLVALGDVYLATEDWARATQVVETLRRSDEDAAKAQADSLELKIISNREGRERGIDFLQGLVDNNPGSISTRAALIKAQLQEDNGDGALKLAEELVADMPDDPRAALVLGNTQLALADFAAAEATFRETVEKNPTNSQAAMQHLRTLTAMGRPDEAAQVVDQSLERMPGNADLLWAKASLLERQKDIDGAITIYEQLYERNSGSQLIANNLASLLVTYRDDEESLARATLVGKRLRGTEFPAFQDTYGWILYRSGDLEEAVTYLEPAAAALQNDPIVQFHLGQTYLGLGRNEEALAQFEKVIALVDPADPRPQIAEARETLQRLSQN